MKLLKFLDRHAFLTVAIVLAIILFTGALIFWAFGAFTIYVFNIDYDWTFFHGLFCEALYLLLKDMLTPKQ